MATISDLSVTLTDSKTTSVVPGADYSGFPIDFGAPNNDYTVTVTNNGPDTVTQFTLHFDPGAGLTWTAQVNPSVNGSVGTLSLPNGSDVNTWLWSGLSLASGQSAFTTFTYRIDPSATSPLTLTATVIAPGRPTPTPPTIAPPTATRRHRRPTWRSP